MPCSVATLSLLAAILANPDEYLVMPVKEREAIRSSVVCLSLHLRHAESSGVMPTKLVLSAAETARMTAAAAPAPDTLSFDDLEANTPGPAGDESDGDAAWTVDSQDERFDRAEGQPEPAGAEGVPTPDRGTTVARLDTASLTTFVLPNSRSVSNREWGHLRLMRESEVKLMCDTRLAEVKEKEQTAREAEKEKEQTAREKEKELTAREKEKELTARQTTTETLANAVKLKSVDKEIADARLKQTTAELEKERLARRADLEQERLARQADLEQARLANEAAAKQAGADKEKQLAHDMAVRRMELEFERDKAQRAEAAAAALEARQRKQQRSNELRRAREQRAAPVTELSAAPRAPAAFADVALENSVSIDNLFKKQKTGGKRSGPRRKTTPVRPTPGPGPAPTGDPSPEMFEAALPPTAKNVTPEQHERLLEIGRTLTLAYDTDTLTRLKVQRALNLSRAFSSAQAKDLSLRLVGHACATSCVFYWFVQTCLRSFLSTMNRRGGGPAPRPPCERGFPSSP